MNQSDCPRCRSLALPGFLYAGTIPVLPCLRCPACGWLFGERLLDLHHGLQPHELPSGHDPILPVYDPASHRMVYDTARSKWTFRRVAPPREEPPGEAPPEEWMYEAW